MPTAENDQELWLEAFDRTGFALEYQIQQILRDHQWHVMNSRYYLDDRTGAEREIDIVAYKRNVAGETVCVTYLIVSCKKSAKSSWVFLTSDFDAADEDFDCCPMEMAASDPRIRRLLASEKTLAADMLLRIDPYEKICGVPHKVLSFQQINRESHKPEDDKQIFASIITAVKAANYERKHAVAHKPRQKDIFLDFHLLSVFEGGLKENYRGGGSNTVKDITEIKYINRHIIDETDRFYRVHFISNDAFETALEQYDRAAEALPTYYTALREEFRRDLFSEEKRARMEPFWEEFKDELFKEMWDSLEGDDDQGYFNNSWLSDYRLDSEKGTLLLYWDMGFITDPKNSIVRLNKNKLLHKKTGEKLYDYFDYSGPFLFVLEPNPFFKG